MLGFGELPYLPRWVNTNHGILTSWEDGVRQPKSLRYYQQWVDKTAFENKIAWCVSSSLSPRDWRWELWIVFYSEHIPGRRMKTGRWLVETASPFHEDAQHCIGRLSVFSKRQAFHMPWTALTPEYINSSTPTIWFCSCFLKKGCPCLLKTRMSQLATVCF